MCVLAGMESLSFVIGLIEIMMTDLDLIILNFPRSCASMIFSKETSASIVQAIKLVSL